MRCSDINTKKLKAMLRTASKIYTGEPGVRERVTRALTYLEAAISHAEKGNCPDAHFYARRGYRNLKAAQQMRHRIEPWLRG